MNKVLRINKVIKKESGQSLLEMLIALAVMVLVILALVVVTTISVRNADFSRRQILATQYAQASIEEARSLRETQPKDTFFSSGSCTGTDLVSTFSRTRTCTFDGDKTMTVAVVVTWTDAKGDHQSQLTTRLTKW